MAELIIALDTPSPEAALNWASSLAPCARWFKVGLELFVAAGPDFLHALKGLSANLRVFLDLKFYDIPNTAAGAALSAAKTGADMLTIHCQGGERMCRAVMRAIEPLGAKAPMIMGVTALTSFADGEMPGVALPAAVFGRELAALAFDWGLSGVICSGQEAAAVRSAAPALKIVCPGIRPLGARIGDQRRIMTPAAAVAAGADFLVVGRPVTAAPDPVAAVRGILAEMNAYNDCSSIGGRDDGASR